MGGRERESHSVLSIYEWIQILIEGVYAGEREGGKNRKRAKGNSEQGRRGGEGRLAPASSMWCGPLQIPIMTERQGGYMQGVSRHDIA